MSHRLQVLIPPELDAQIEKAAQRSRISKGEWVRRVIQISLRTDGTFSEGHIEEDPLARLAALDAPTADIETMLSEIEQGRG